MNTCWITWRRTVHRRQHHLEPGQSAPTARVTRRHLDILFAMFGAHVQKTSDHGPQPRRRGRGHRHASQPAGGVGYNINAVISLAPRTSTPSSTSVERGPDRTWSSTGLWTGPGGISDTGFELYDNASGMKKSMMFVYRSCHDRYNTVWGDGDLGFGKLTPADVARVLSVDSHHKIAMGYMVRFTGSIWEERRSSKDCSAASGYGGSPGIDANMKIIRSTRIRRAHNGRF